MAINRNNQSRNRKKLVSEIDPNTLIKKASPQKTITYKSKLNFSQLNLHKSLLNNINEKGYKSPTEIQEKCVEPIISKKNIIGVAETGTGKTAAFLIPLIQQKIEDKDLHTLILVPTRELAQQIETEFKTFSKKCQLSSSCFIGGTNINKDISKAKTNTRLIVGTPGRIKDLIDRRVLNLKQTNTLVLDEFDRMLDMGFIHDLLFIVDQMKNRSQTLLFSATIANSQKKIINQIVKNSIKINISRGKKSSENVHQNIIKLKENENKFQTLVKLIKNASCNKVILFEETKHSVNKLSKQLNKSGIKSDVIHGNKAQNYRTKAINQFKKGITNVLVATDVASRGIDIDGVTHVINYQLPKTMDSYIHRIGRTGRAGKIGYAYTFVN
jgi:ATP-dependent RNA helicase RhlE